MASKTDKPVIDKTLNVVFQRKKLPKETSVYTETVKLHPRCSEIVKDIAKQTLRKKIEDMRAEFERADDKSNLQFTQLVNAVEQAKALEITTNKFVDKVESTMKSFNIDIGKYQKMYEQIMQNLPPSAVPATSTTKVQQNIE